MYIDKLDDIVDEYNNTYYRTIKMKPIDVKSSTYIYFGDKINNWNPKLDFGNHIKTSTYIDISAKGYTPNWYEEDFVIK